ncbi:hypothetical protein SDC49_02935 [Lactobacillus sp. R2/2]|nr:hypothetical protein [Lactobacillus sp. R2/2]
MLNKISKTNIPIVAIDAPIKGLKSDAVVVNNYESSKTGINYLIKRVTAISASLLVRWIIILPKKAARL